MIGEERISAASQLQHHAFVCQYATITTNTVQTECSAKALRLKDKHLASTHRGQAFRLLGCRLSIGEFGHLLLAVVRLKQVQSGNKSELGGCKLMLARIILHHMLTHLLGSLQKGAAKLRRMMPDRGHKRSVGR